MKKRIIAAALAALLLQPAFSAAAEEAVYYFTLSEAEKAADTYTFTLQNNSITEENTYLVSMANNLKGRWSASENYTERIDNDLIHIIRGSLSDDFIALNSDWLYGEEVVGRMEDIIFDEWYGGSINRTASVFRVTLQPGELFSITGINSNTPFAVVCTSRVQKKTYVKSAGADLKRAEDNWVTGCIMNKNAAVLMGADGEDTSLSVDCTAWAEDKIREAHASGLICDELIQGLEHTFNGGEIRYSMTGPCTREDFAVLVINLLKQVENTPTASELLDKHSASFPRVGTFNDTSNESVLAAYALGIAAGYGDGVFAPDDSLTREQAAVMLMNAAKLMGLSEKSAVEAFADGADISSWAVQAVAYCRANGIMNGTSADTFTPKQTFSHEQCITTVLNLFKMQK